VYKYRIVFRANAVLNGDSGPFYREALDERTPSDVYKHLSDDLFMHSIGGVIFALSDVLCVEEVQIGG
jgi:hypothetical protein